MFFKKKVIDRATLLQELNLLGFGARTKRISLLALEYKDTEGYVNLFTSLLKGTAFEAHLALVGAAAIQDSKIVLLALQHQSSSVRKKATKHLAAFVSDEVVEQELAQLSTDCRGHLLRMITQARRQTLAERLLPVVLDTWGAREALILLPICTEETVSLRLTEIGFAVQNWSKLVLRHPAVVAAYFKSTLETATPRERSNIWWRFSTAIEPLCALKADLILECAVNFTTAEAIHPLIKNRLRVLIRRNPTLVFALLTRKEARAYLVANGVPTSILKARTAFSLDQWKVLAALVADHPVHIAELIRHFAPSERASLFESAYPEALRKTRIFPESLLSTLPHALREKEAVRMLALREVADYRDNVLNITACRLIEHSREMLQMAAQSSNAEDRVAALRHLVKSTALSRQGISETLTFLTKIKNEQDPVRYGVMTELSHASAKIFLNEHVVDLSVLVDSVVQARDTSYGTRMATQKLALGIVQQHVDAPESQIFKFGISTMVQLARQNGTLTLPSLAENLPKGLENIVFEALYPLVVAENRKENYGFVISLANALGKKGRRIVKLQQSLQEAVNSSSEFVSMNAATLWLEPKDTRDERVQWLLRRDNSFIKVNEVFLHLHRRRQEWLDPFLTGAIITGKFLTGKTIYVTPAVDGFHKWLPRQQQSLALLLEKIAFDPFRNTTERTYAIKVMAKMPDLRRDQLFKLLKSDELAIVESSLHALSLIEESETALPILLENLDGDKARVAMYAIPRCIRRAAPRLFHLTIKELLNRDDLKITVRKEAVRLLGVYNSGDSIKLLRSEFEKEMVHKDVLIAIGHAARKFLKDEEGWKILTEIASSAQPDVAKSLLNQDPNELPICFRSRYLELIAKIAEHQSAEVSRAALASLARWTDGNEISIANLTSNIILNLEESTKWVSAMDTFLVACVDGQVNEQVIDVFRQLSNQKIEERWNADTQRDLPHRQRLFRFTQKLTELPMATRHNLHALFEGIIENLAANNTMTSVTVKFLVASIDWSDVNSAIDQISKIVNCVSLYPHLVKAALTEIEISLSNARGYWEPEKLLLIITRLSAQTGETFPYISLALLNIAGPALQWNQESADLLRTFRNHQNIDISTQALGIWTSVE